LHSIELTGEPFVSRYLEHAPIRRMHYARSYGLYANGNKPKRELARGALGLEPEPPAEKPDWRQVVERFTGQNPERCPICGCPLVVVEVPAQSNSPPTRRAG
jgi:hypothetical protein